MWQGRGLLAPGLCIVEGESPGLGNVAGESPVGTWAT